MKEISEVCVMVKDVVGDDEMVVMVKEEIDVLMMESDVLVEIMTLALLSKDSFDEKNIMFEICVGIGGDEVGIWVGDLY